MGKNLPVFVDIDDTISHTQREILKYVNQRSVGTSYKYEELTRSDRDKSDDSDYATLVQEWLRVPTLVSKTKPVSGSLSAFKLLYHHNYQIHMVSSRKENLHSITEEWLGQHGFTDYIHDIHKRHSSVSGEEFKLQTAKKITPEIIFDDTWSVAEVLAEHGYYVHLIDTPWNRDMKHKNVVRCKNFVEAVDIFLNK